MNVTRFVLLIPVFCLVVSSLHVGTTTACLRQENSTVEENGSEARDRSASGVVLDSENRPVAGAIVAHIRWEDGERVDYKTVTDEQGKFRIEFPNESRRFEMYHVWAYKKGYPCRVVCLARMMKEKGIVTDIEIRFPPKQEFSVQVLNCEGAPLADHMVTIAKAQVPNGVFAANKSTGLTGFVPKTISEMLNLKTDRAGRLTIDSFTEPLLQGIRIQSETSGTQDLFVNKNAIFKLAPTGSILGQIHASNPENYAGTKISIVSDCFVDNRVEGSAIVEVDSEGKFEVPNIAAGTIRWVRVDWDDSQDIYPLKLRRREELRAGETLVIESQHSAVPMVEVEGCVRTADSKIPVAGAFISIRDIRGHNPSLTADMGGNFYGRFAAGKVTVQVITMGDDAMELYQNYDYPTVKQLEIRANGNLPFTIPDMLLTPKSTVKGQLLAKDGKPAAAETIVLSRGIYGHTHGHATTDENGRFEMKVSRKSHLNVGDGSDHRHHYAIIRKREGYGENQLHEKLEMLRTDPDDLLLQIK